MTTKRTTGFIEEIEEKIKIHALLKKLDFVTFINLCSISRNDYGKAEAEKLALLAEAVALKEGLGKSAKAAFFGGLTHYNKEKMLLYFPFKSYDDDAEKRKKVKNFVTALSKRCEEGNVFISCCVCLDYLLKEKKYRLTAKDFSCQELDARKFSKITVMIGKIIKISDKVINAKKEGAVDIKKLGEEFPGDIKIIKIAVEEAEKF